MAHPWYHAVSSARRQGGVPEDYLELHSWFDQTKSLVPDVRHRALLHNAFGIFLAEQVFGPTITLSTCGRCGKPESEHPWREDDLLLPKECLEFKPKVVPTRLIGEQHVREDLGMIPTAEHWLTNLKVEPWMTRSRKLSRELEQEEATR